MLTRVSRPGHSHEADDGAGGGGSDGGGPGEDHAETLRRGDEQESRGQSPGEAGGAAG